MASLTSSISHPKKLTILFLNTSFLLLLFSYLSISNFRGQFSNEPNIITPTTTSTHSLVLNQINADDCSSLHDYSGYEAKCLYVKSETGCRPKGYLNYLQIFYCTCGQFPLLGLASLLLWLLVLFYLLGNTASIYFCSSLESLSRILKLSPTIAGVTLLSLGNGAPDVFASIVSFTRSSNGGVGLNGILGGAFFVSSTVVGVISVLICSQTITVDKPSFIRDVMFFLFSLSALLVIILIGKISLWGSICFVSIYFLYVFTVSVTHFSSRKKEIKKMNILPVLASISPSPASNSNKSTNILVQSQDDLADLGIPLLGCVDDEKPILAEKITTPEDQEKSKNFFNLDSPIFYYLGKFLYVLELPLYLPRRLTIPVVSEEKWSKPFAVISVTLAPVLVAALCNSQREKNWGSKGSLVSYMITCLIGMVLGNLAFVTTKRTSPPKKCLFPWLAGGFLMSVTWTYIIAEELVSLLVSLGNILGINPSVLGLTVLAWGNSLGDLIANVAMAMNGGPDGAQIAISGCYAGPMFSTLMGLGVSFVITSWSEYPACYVIPTDPSLYETLGFLMGGLLWALVILPRKNMRLDRFLGGGLLAIYLCFLSLRLARACGLLNLQGFSFFKG